MFAVCSQSQPKDESPLLRHRPADAFCRLSHDADGNSTNSNCGAPASSNLGNTVGKFVTGDRMQQELGHSELSFLESSRVGTVTVRRFHLAPEPTQMRRIHDCIQMVQMTTEDFRTPGVKCSRIGRNASEQSFASNCVKHAQRQRRFDNCDSTIRPYTLNALGRHVLGVATILVVCFRAA